MYNRRVESNRIDSLSPAAFAFIGDAVHTLFVRERLLAERDGGTGTLHVAASRMVNANIQAEVYDALCLDNAFTAEEADIARRAKNAHLHSRSKAADSAAYHKATALEAVLGYVHLTGRGEREKELLEKCLSATIKFLSTRA